MTMQSITTNKKPNIGRPLRIVQVYEKLNSELNVHKIKSQFMFNQTFTNVI